MPVRRRIRAVRPPREVPNLYFRIGDGRPFISGKAAERAWHRQRRAVWAGTMRFCIPGAATDYDKLTNEAFRKLNDPRSFLTWEKGMPPAMSERDSSKQFRIAAAAWFEADRRNLAAFEATAAGRSIRDFLAMYRADLDTLEESWQAGMYRRLVTSRTYGHDERGAARAG